MDAEMREFLEAVAGERCPCGHSKDEHEPPYPELILGGRETLGACTRCDCRGVIEFDDGEDW